MALLANVEEVQNLTGVTVKTDQIRQAQGIIDLVSGRSLDDVTRLSSRDQAYLKSAVIYQAAWMDSHPEVVSTMDVSSISQPDLNVRFRDDREAHLLAPLAQVALRRVSWRRSKSVSARSVFANQQTERWVPMR